MLSSNAPTKIIVPWGNAADASVIRTIATTSQNSVNPGQASWPDGFPISAVAVPGQTTRGPSIKDFNGIFNQITNVQRWQSGGGLFKYDPAWSSANGGYPRGAMLAKANGTGVWFSLVDNNTTNPDTTSTPDWTDISTLYYGTDASTDGINFVVTCPINLPYLTDGLTVRFKASRAALGGLSTLAVNGLAAKPLLQGGVTRALSPGIFGVGDTIHVVWSSTADAWYISHTTGQRLRGVLPGEVRFFASTTTPDGFVRCNGALLSRARYAALFEVIGTTYGVGDGVTTFQLPDFRGEFIRCLDDGRNVDPAGATRSLSQWQDSDNRSHFHYLLSNGSPFGLNAEAAVRASINVGSGLLPDNNSNYEYSLVSGSGSASIGRSSTSGGVEARPRNYPLLACMAY